jgi:hypothetical protein
MHANLRELVISVHSIAKLKIRTTTIAGRDVVLTLYKSKLVRLIQLVILSFADQDTPVPTTAKCGMLISPQAFSLKFVGHTKSASNYRSLNHDKNTLSNLMPDPYRNVL